MLFWIGRNIAEYVLSERISSEVPIKLYDTSSNDESKKHLIWLNPNSDQIVSSSLLASSKYSTNSSQKYDVLIKKYGEDILWFEHLDRTFWLLLKLCDSLEEIIKERDLEIANLNGALSERDGG